MPEWLLWMAVAWVAVGCGAGCRRRGRRRRRRVREASGRGAVGPAEAGRPREAKRVAAGSGSAPGGATKESAVEALQRRYVDGALSLEQYEAELDRLDRRELL